MICVVFVGPTLARDPLLASKDFAWLPPAAQGDVYRASLARPAAIALIDGYFETVPAVWHKEILFALSQGIHVFGAASMGALRAAELHIFGMVGVGAIFEAFRDGVFEDDDEVAVTHAPAELGYAPLSEAMVNVRATVARALAESVVDAATAETILRAAKSIFYKDRTWASVLVKAADVANRPSRIEDFRDWLPNGAVDQKREDARRLLDQLAALRHSSLAPFKPDFEFQDTLDWQQVVAEHGRA